MKRWHDTPDPKRRGWILNDNWLNALREDGSILLYIHPNGSWMERMHESLDGTRIETLRIMDLDADEVIQWCEDNAIECAPSPIRAFDSVRGIVLKDENDEFAFKMRWPSFR